MSNKIKIKHGIIAPTADNLENFELGYANDNKGLYIKDESNNVVHLNDISKIEEELEELKGNIGNASGVVVSETEPESTNVLWIDISDDGTGDTSGVAKYFDEQNSMWTEVVATWG